MPDDTYWSKYRRPGDRVDWAKQVIPLRVFFWRMDFGPKSYALGSRLVHRTGHPTEASSWTESPEGVERWVGQTNKLLGYLSGGHCSFELMDVETKTTIVPTDCRDLGGYVEWVASAFGPREPGFRMYIPTDFPYGSMLGVYLGRGDFVLGDESFSAGEDSLHPKYSLTGLHEVGHGLAGAHHCTTRNCLMRAKKVEGSDSTLLLCRREAELLNWPVREPLDLRVMADL